MLSLRGVVFRTVCINDDAHFLIGPAPFYNPHVPDRDFKPGTTVRPGINGLSKTATIQKVAGAEG
jgi:hypothetical protein